MLVKIIINEKEFLAEQGAPLKNILTEYGMAFPCGGNGQCGKCRILAKDIPPTEKDRRFLSESALNEGWRIACDKTASEVSIQCPPPTHPIKSRELSSCNIVAYVGVSEIKIGIADDEIAETLTITNPLYGEGGFAELSENYSDNPQRVTKTLRAVLAKESIELFEKYGKAKAETFAIATNEVFGKILIGSRLDEEVDFSKTDGCFDLPTETVYFLPMVNAYIGGDVLAETVGMTENTLFVECNEIFTVVMIGKDNNVAAAMWDMTYDEIGLRAIYAAIKTVMDTAKGITPFVRVYGKYAEEIEDILLNLGLEYSIKEKDLASCGKVLQGLRTRVKLNKEKTRTSVLNILNNDEFHDYLSQGGTN